jgi:hypothetical protein
VREAQIALLAWYHTEKERFRAFDLVGGIVPGFTVSNRMVLFVPADLLYWTREVERAVRALDTLAGEHGATAKVLHVTGRLTPLAAARLRASGYEVVQAFVPGN